MDSRTNSPAIPIAIVIGFALIAIAIYFTGNRNTPTVVSDPNQPVQVTSSNISPVTEDDYIRGNPNAQIMLVEYSDYDCPFCKVFHTTMKTIMDDYGITGNVAWAYRQFPIQSLHPNAPRISEAALCVGELGGNDAFWKFSDQVFDDREPNQPTNMTMLPRYAEEAGVDRAQFESCLNSGRMTQKVADSVAEGVAAGIQGTPHTVLIVGGQQTVINGAQPYAVVKEIIDNIITQLNGGTL